MALPLPKVIPDTEAGGGVVTAMKGMNALSNDMLNRQITSVKAQYAPMTTQAEAASKLAYANLMGPQFLAKLMGHQDVVANSPQLRDPATIQRLYQAGMGAGTGNALMGGQGMPQSQGGGNPFSMPPPQQNFSLSSWLADKMKNVFSGGDQQGGSAPQPSQNPMVDLSNMQPGQSYTNNSSSPQMVTMRGVHQGTGADSGMEYDQNGNNVVGNPAQVPVPQSSNTYAENAGNFAGIKAEGEELGKARGAAIADLGKQQLDLSNSGVILDRLTGITQNPEFQKMRDQIPYFQDKQLWYLSKNGTPQQQKLIGDLISTAQAFKASTVNSFKGKALEKEFNLADKIKIDENDTMGVIQGKLASLKTLKDIAESKNNSILGLMTNNHMNLGDATARANKMVDTSAIEKQVDSVLNPQPTEHDIQYMMQKRNLPRAEIIKQLKARGYTNVS